MQRLIVNVLALTTVIASLVAQTPPTATPASRPRMALTSTAFDDGGIIPEKYTAAVFPPGIPPQRSKHTSPPLAWSNVPDGTVSFVLRLHDPDEVVNHRTDEVRHWLMINIPTTVREVPEAVPPQAQLPDGSIQLLNQVKMVGYLSPGASHEGPYHHYTFSLFALDTMLNLGPDATETDVDNAMQGHILAKAVLVGRFRRP